MNNDLFFEFLDEVQQEMEDSIFCRYYTFEGFHISLDVSDVCAWFNAYIPLFLSVMALILLLLLL
jgi:hypothetical protein